ncbi:Prefoldin beta-like protein [Globomyces pollinis-pini]|nr:Prefoldin beta-like protein [Globomyces pollinis-pini]KAJ2996399.1 hypothetical protein HDV02_006548 [Globomyces sp. JEL0801]
MKLVDKKDEVDVEVTWEDQNNINKFSKLNARLDVLEEELKTKTTEKEYLDDLVMELELADEDELIPYRIGDSFVSLSLEQCQERIESEQSDIVKQVDDYQNDVNSIHSEMAKLKAMLYGKFGNSINLEK